MVPGALPPAQPAAADVAMAARGRGRAPVAPWGESTRPEAMRAVAVLRTAGAPERLAVVLAVAAEAQAEAGNLDPALQLATESVAIAQASGDGRTLARACRALGELHGILGQCNESARLLGQALRASSPTDDGEVHAHILDALCRNTLRLADRARQTGTTPAEELQDDAIEHGRRGLETARQARDPRAESDAAQASRWRCCAGATRPRAAFLVDAGAPQPRAAPAQHRIAAIDGEALLARGEAKRCAGCAGWPLPVSGRAAVDQIDARSRSAGAKAQDDGAGAR
jgi:tetratricopeptide (TPR) repeat protein